MFHACTSNTILTLFSLEQGRNITLILTKATQDCVLEFKHSNDDDWIIYPAFSGIVEEGILIEEFRCISSNMRIRFLAAPTQDYYASMVTEERGW